MNFTAFLMMSFLLGEVPQLPFLNQSKFNLELDRPFIANRSPVEIREFLQRISDDHNVAILLDRRIDPSHRLTVALDEPYLDEAIRRLSKQVNADLVVIADTLYVAPTPTVQSLRTYVHALQEELDEVCKEDRKRQAELVKRKPVHWEMLSTPTEILEQIGANYQLHIQNLDQLPHDVWPQGDISYPNSVEALSIVLIQFDLSFEWLDADTIKLIPLPPLPLIEQLHRPKGMSLSDAEELVRQRYPDLILERTGTRFSVAARIEDHETISELIGERKPRREGIPRTESIPLEKRIFTLKMVRQPFLSLMQSLTKQGIEVRYNAQQMEAAGIDLTQKISLELQQATIDDLLRLSCKEVNVTYRTEGLVIFLEPAAPQ